MKTKESGATRCVFDRIGKVDDDMAKPAKETQTRS